MEEYWARPESRARYEQLLRKPFVQPPGTPSLPPAVQPSDAPGVPGTAAG